MRKSRLILSLFISLNGLLYSQKKKDTLLIDIVKEIYYDELSPEESWRIHKMNYIKTLKAKGLTPNEIEEKVKAYEKQKDKFIKNIEKQRKIARLNRQNASIRRNEAEERKKTSQKTQR